jgi:hypothetical protein
MESALAVDLWVVSSNLAWVHRLGREVVLRKISQIWKFELNIE